MLSWDTGDSFGLTPFSSGFVDYVGCDIPIKDITKFNKVILIGTTIHRFKNINGDDVYLPFVYYHLPTSEICLFSLQNYHNMHYGESSVYYDIVDMNLSRHEVVIQIDIKGSNIPFF